VSRKIEQSAKKNSPYDDLIYLGNTMDYKKISTTNWIEICKNLKCKVLHINRNHCPY